MHSIKLAKQSKCACDLCMIHAIKVVPKPTYLPLCIPPHLPYYLSNLSPTEYFLQNPSELATTIDRSEEGHQEKDVSAANMCHCRLMFEVIKSNMRVNLERSEEKKSIPPRDNEAIMAKTESETNLSYLLLNTLLKELDIVPEDGSSPLVSAALQKTDPMVISSGTSISSEGTQKSKQMTGIAGQSGTHEGSETQPWAVVRQSVRPSSNLRSKNVNGARQKRNQPPRRLGPSEMELQYLHPVPGDLDYKYWKVLSTKTLEMRRQCTYCASYMPGRSHRFCRNHFVNAYSIPWFRRISGLGAFKEGHECPDAPSNRMVFADFESMVTLAQSFDMADQRQQLLQEMLLQAGYLPAPEDLDPAVSEAMAQTKSISTQE